MNSNECEYCHKVYSSIYNLTTHQKTTKSCISNRVEIPTNIKNIECEHCHKSFTAACSLRSHFKICKVLIKKKNELEKNQRETELNVFKREIEERIKDLEDKSTQIKIDIPIKIFDDESKEDTINSSDIKMDAKTEEISDVKEYKFGSDFIVPI